MKVFITGGTGFVGRTLTEKLIEKGHSVTILTRAAGNKHRKHSSTTLIEGDPSRPGPWQEKVPEHDAIVNLAGASIFSRWTKKEKERILESRVLTTKNLVESLSRRDGKGKIFLSNSAVGYYGFTGDELLDEDNPPGKDFLADVTRQWEAAALAAEEHDARVVICRLGIVLGKGGGALSEMLSLFKKGLGSPLGSGKQWFSWIHEKDLADIYLFLMERENVRGPVNLTAPNPVRNRALTYALAKSLGKRVLLPPVPGFMIRLVKGEFGSVVLKGQRVIPARLTEENYTFRFPDIEGALKDLVNN
jgi:uncharacterized protein (TIGR01777 family)